MLHKVRLHACRTHFENDHRLKVRKCEHTVLSSSLSSDPDVVVCCSFASAVSFGASSPSPSSIPSCSNYITHQSTQNTQNHQYINVTSRGPFFHLSLLNGKLSAQSNNVEDLSAWPVHCYESAETELFIVSCVFDNLFPFLLCFHLSIYLLGACVCPHTTLVTPFSTCNNGKKKKKKFTPHKFVYTFQTKHLIYKVVVIQGISNIH